MDKKYSIILQSKIPAYIREKPTYSKFIEFFESYYNWFNDTYSIQSISDNMDIDADYELFLPYFTADFLPYFPDEIKADKIKLLKIVKELYKAKGIPTSFKFLFKALYDSYSETIPTREFVLRASASHWIVSKSVKIKSSDTRFLKLNNYKIYGELSQSIALIETSKLVGNKIQIYLADIQRLFLSGETIRILDSSNKDVYFLNGEIVTYDKTPPIGSELLKAKIIGSLSSININPTFRGGKYKVNDPIVITGGLNTELTNPVKASAYVSEITTGQIVDIEIKNGGYGFNISPNSTIDVIYNGSVDTIAKCVISNIDSANSSYNTLFPINSIANNLNIQLSSNNYNFSVNNVVGLNTTLANSFTFISLTGAPISATVVLNGGGGYEIKPTLQFNSLLESDSNQYEDLKSFGILAPIKIQNPGLGYSNTDTISINGGDGDFAFAKINSVNSAGSITSVGYISSNNSVYTTGGMGYKQTNLPTIKITSNTGSNAVLVIPGILGSGVEYDLLTNKIGSITKISLSENGEDYISTPNVSLRVMDIITSNVSISTFEDCVVFQGSGDTPSQTDFTALGESVTVIDKMGTLQTTDDIYSFRIYDYKGSVDYTQPLKIYNTKTSKLSSFVIESSRVYPSFTNGIRIYGDGSAKATAKFLDGLIVGDGAYLNNDNQLSSFSVLQSDEYNSSSYFLLSEKDYVTSKDPLLNLTHPLGTHVLPKILLRSYSNVSANSNTCIIQSTPLNNTTISLITSGNTGVSNTFSVSGNVLSIAANNTIFIQTNNNMNVYSTVKLVDVSNSTIQLNTNIQYKYPNIYFGNASSNTINIIKSNYPETRYWSNNFIFVGDSIEISGNSYSVINIVDTTIYFSNNIQQIIGTSNTLFTLNKLVSSNTVKNYTLG